MTALGWCWQLATTKKRHFFLGPQSLCKRHWLPGVNHWAPVPHAVTRPTPDHYQCRTCHRRVLALLSLISPEKACSPTSS